VGVLRQLPARRSMPDIRRNREIKCYAAAQYVSTAMRDKGAKERLLSALAPGNVRKIKDGVRAVMVVVAYDLRFCKGCRSSFRKNSRRHARIQIIADNEGLVGSFRSAWSCDNSF
jgi:hypothetical protein